MEHAQRGVSVPVSCALEGVLILILMEHAQRVYKMAPNVVITGAVLILILMEHAQRVIYSSPLARSSKKS